MEQIDPPEDVTSNVGLGPIWTDLNGNLDRKVLRCAVFGLYKCVHHRLYDWQYTYCAAQPDTGGALRPGGGTQLHGWGPNESCPYLPPNINEAERMTETAAERKGDGV
ncbi:MAG: hypothetical protein RIR43_1407 [Pseudomonadota bacterium]|jgi:hypothetical protein